MRYIEILIHVPSKKKKIIYQALIFKFSRNFKVSFFVISQFLDNDFLSTYNPATLRKQSLLHSSSSVTTVYYLLNMIYFNG